MTNPYPADETADDVRAMLRQHHPDLSDAQLDALLSGPPAKKRKGWAPKSHRTAGIKGRSGQGIVSAGGLSRAIGRKGHGRR